MRRAPRFESRPAVVLGIDLSYSRTGLVAIPMDWGVDFGRVTYGTCGMHLEKGAGEEAKARRCALLADEVVAFAEGVGATHVYVENYAFGQEFAGPALGELRGVVRHVMVERIGLAPVPLAIAACRRYFFGYVPKGRGKIVKAQVAKAIARLGVDVPNHDVADAFVVANYGLMEAGGVGLTFGA